MKRILRWVGIVLGGLVALLVLVVAGMVISTDMRFNRQYDIQPEAVTIPTDTASLATGKRWAEIQCQSCHAPDLGGGPFFEGDLGYVDAPNLTAGKGGVGATNTDADWVRAIRHGIKADGTSVFIMPSNDFYYLSDADLGSIIAYVKTVPSVDREIRPRALTPMAKVLYAAGVFPNLLYAETIAHDAPRPSAPAASVTLDYGEYLVNTHGCRSCHGEQLNGGLPSEPGAPFAHNLTPGGELGGWSEADFFKLMREGTTPTGRAIEYMPWQELGKMTDDELEAVWLYLQSLPKLPTAEQ